MFSKIVSMFILWVGFGFSSFVPFPFLCFGGFWDPRIWGLFCVLRFVHGPLVKLIPKWFGHKHHEPKFLLLRGILRKPSLSIGFSYLQHFCFFGGFDSFEISSNIPKHHSLGIFEVFWSVFFIFGRSFHCAGWDNRPGRFKPPPEWPSWFVRRPAREAGPCRLYSGCQP
jgi:hypothetical protein